MKRIGVKSCNLTSLLESSAKLDNVKRFVVGGTVKNDLGEYLLLKRAANDFMGGLEELPSGKVEPGESILDALQREIKEETNLNVKSVNEYLGSFDYKSKSGATTRQFNFDVKVDEFESLKTSEEHERAIWVAANSIHRFNISEPVRKILFDQIQEQLVEQAQSESIKRFVVGGIIKNREGKILLLKRAANDFMGGLDELPSGKVEAGESLIPALIREIKEETNLNVSSVHGYLGYFDYKSKSGAPTRQFNFEVQVEDCSTLQTSDEHECAIWVLPDKTNEFNVSEAVRNVLLPYSSAGIQH